jgi:N-acetylmuramoyl-L-alanine amidase
MSIFKKLVLAFAKPNPALAEAQQFIHPERLPSLGDQKVHLGIIVGHEKAAQGATMPGGLTEYQYNSLVAEELERVAKDYPWLTVTTIKRDGIGIWGAYQAAKTANCDAVIELHFNAFDEVSEGTETLCTADSDDIDFAHYVHRAMCEVFGRSGESRGVVVIGKTSRGGANVYAFPDGVNCLVEPFFGDNAKEAALGNDKREAYAKALLLATVIWAKRRGLIKAEL